MIEITETANNKLKEILNKNPGKFIRVVVDGSSCCGPSLGLTLDEPQKDETPVKVGDLDILISEDIRDFVRGRQIEYYSYQNQGWFTVERPGSASCC